MRFADQGTAKERKAAARAELMANWKIRPVPAARGRRGLRELDQLKRRSDRAATRLAAAIAEEKDELVKTAAEAKLEELKAGRVRLNGAKVSGEFGRALTAIAVDRATKTIENAEKAAGTDVGCERKKAQLLRKARWARRRARRDDSINRAAMFELAALLPRPRRGRAGRRERDRMFNRIARAKVTL